MKAHQPNPSARKKRDRWHLTSSPAYASSHLSPALGALAVLALCLGCVAPPRQAVESLAHSWSILRPYAEDGIKAEAERTHIAPESLQIRLRLVEEHTKTLEELLRYATD